MSAIHIFKRSASVPDLVFKENTRCTSSKVTTARSVPDLHFQSVLQPLPKKPSKLRYAQFFIAVQKLSSRIRLGCRDLYVWVINHPLQAIGLSLGAVAMFTVVFWLAPVITATVSSLLIPSLGVASASILGTAIGGGLASGSRSLLVHITPMVVGVDPFNSKQLSIDVSMSATFGFFGFAQAAALTAIATSLGVSGIPLFIVTAVGLIGYEVLKDFLQNAIRNNWANDPKSFRDIWFQSLSMETLTNLHRCVPGLDLATNFGAKVVADILGTIWWDRIINKRNDDA